MVTIQIPPEACDQIGRYCCSTVSPLRNARRSIALCQLRLWARCFGRP